MFLNTGIFLNRCVDKLIMDSYEKLLQKAQEELPETTASSERFKVDNIRGHLEGNKTILVNLRKIARDLLREPEQLLKFLLKELATPGKFSGDRVILGTKVAASKINKKIRQYVGEYVLCPKCGKPDTKLIKKGEYQLIKCAACGHEHPIKSI